MIRKTMMKRSAIALAAGTLAFAAVAVWAQNAAAPASAPAAPYERLAGPENHRVTARSFLQIAHI